MSYDRYLEWRDAPLEQPLDLSVVIPAYNEKDRIVPTIGAFAAHLAAGDLAWELIVSDDGSIDDTRSIIAMLDHANVRLVQAPANAGKGAAVRRGVAAARGRMVLFADADCSTPVVELERLMSEVTGGSDVAVGSRAALGARVENRSPFRRILTAGLRSVVRFGLGLPVKDTQCGFKLFSSEAAGRLFEVQTVDGFSFDLELLYLARRLGMDVAEVPVRWYDAPGSKVDTGKEVIRFVTSILRIRLNALRGVYGHG